MTEHMPDQLTAAIDRVATRLVTVEPDQRMADRIASQLPERSAARSWMIMLAPQIAAAVGVVLLAFFLFSNRPTQEGEPSATVLAGVPMPVVEVPRTIPRAGLEQRTLVVARVDDTLDRDFGLAGPNAIALAAIADMPAIDVPLAEIAPIVLTELPLASDSPLPR
jgi:hypothetical protein